MRAIREKNLVILDALVESKGDFVAWKLECIQILRDLAGCCMERISEYFDFERRFD
jgi:hypothetical protein